MNIKTILNYETKNVKITLFNFRNENNKLTFKLKINDKNKVNIVNKPTNLLVEITQNIKESIMKIGNKKFKFDNYLNEEMLKKNLIAITLTALMSFGVVNQSLASEVETLNTPLIEILDNNSHLGFKTQLDNNNVLIEIYDNNVLKENSVKKREDIKKLHTDVILTKYNAINDIKKLTLEILSDSVSKEELTKINDRLTNHFKNIVIELTMDSDDSGMSKEILSNLRENKDKGYKYEMFLNGFELDDVKNDKNFKNILYNTLVHELSHTIKGALSNDKTLLYDEDISILYQQKLGKKIEGESFILKTLNNKLNLMEINRQFIMTLNEKSLDNKYDILSDEEKFYVFNYLEKIKLEIGEVTYDNREIYGKRTKFTSLDYLSMNELPITDKEKNNYIKKKFKNTLDGKNLQEFNTEISIVENNSLRLRNMIKYINEDKTIQNKSIILNKILYLFGYENKNTNLLIQNITNSFKDDNGIKTIVYPPELN